MAKELFKSFGLASISAEEFSPYFLVTLTNQPAIKSVNNLGEISVHHYQCHDIN